MQKKALINIITEFTIHSHPESNTPILPNESISAHQLNHSNKQKKINQQFANTKIQIEKKLIKISTSSIPLMIEHRILN